MRSEVPGKLSIVAKVCPETTILAPGRHTTGSQAAAIETGQRHVLGCLTVLAPVSHSVPHEPGRDEYRQVGSQKTPERRTGMADGLQTKIVLHPRPNGQGEEGDYDRDWQPRQSQRQPNEGVRQGRYDSLASPQLSESIVGPSHI